MRHPLLYTTAIAALILVGGIAKADNMEKLGNMQATGTSMAGVWLCSHRPEIMADQHSQESRADQAAARLQDQSLRRRSRCAAYGRRASRRGDVCRHAQGRGLGGHRPQQGRRCRRGKALRTVVGLHDSQRGVFFQGWILVRARAQSGPHLPAAEFFYESPDVAVGRCREGGGELIPGADESYNHTARVCAVGPDNKL
jgi:hypothetical protein